MASGSATAITSPIELIAGKPKDDPLLSASLAIKDFSSIHLESKYRKMSSLPFLSSLSKASALSFPTTSTSPAEFIPIFHIEDPPSVSASLGLIIASCFH